MEAEKESKTIMNTLDKAKVDAEMNEKAFL